MRKYKGKRDRTIIKASKVLARAMGFVQKEDPCLPAVLDRRRRNRFLLFSVFLHLFQLADSDATAFKSDPVFVVQTMMVNEFVHKLLQVFGGQFLRIYQHVFAVDSDVHFKFCARNWTGLLSVRPSRPVPLLAFSFPMRTK